MTSLKFYNSNERNEFFDELYNKYKYQVWKSITHFTHNANFAEDIIQETFLIIANKLDQLKDINKCKSWIHVIAYNEAKRQMRKNNYNILQFRSEFDDNDYIKYYASVPDLPIEEEIILNEEVKFTTQAIEMLSYIEKQLFLMKYQQGLTYKEIGRILEEDPKRLKWRMPVILKKLRINIENIRGEKVE